MPYGSALPGGPAGRGSGSFRNGPTSKSETSGRSHRCVAAESRVIVPKDPPTQQLRFRRVVVVRGRAESHRSPRVEPIWPSSFQSLAWRIPPRQNCQASFALMGSDSV
jgi:hypothetical protein